MKRTKLFRGTSLLGFLYALAFSALVILYFSHWQNTLQQEAMRRYWENQAQEIAENQLARQWLGLSCEKRVIQNTVSLQVDCLDEDILVEHPLGEFHLKNR